MFSPNSNFNIFQRSGRTQKVQRDDVDEKNSLLLDQDRDLANKVAEAEAVLRVARRTLEESETIRDEQIAKYESDLEATRTQQRQLEVQLAESHRQQAQLEVELAESQRQVAATTGTGDTTSVAKPAAAPTVSKSTMHGVRTRSKPGPNRLSEYCNITLVGDKYYFLGPAWHIGLNFPDGFSSDPGDMIKNRYVVFGERGSWYRHFHREGPCNGMISNELVSNGLVGTGLVGTRCCTQRSKNFADVYPGLDKFLQKQDAHDCPECISLGVDGQYFFRDKAGHCDYLLPSDLKEKIKSFQSVKKVWLGRLGAFVAVLCRLDLDEVWWDDRGVYTDLGEQIATHWSAATRIPLVFALDLNSSTWIALWENTVQYRNPPYSFDTFHFQEWSTRNAGCTWADKAIPETSSTTPGFTTQGYSAESRPRSSKMTKKKKV